MAKAQEFLPLWVSAPGETIADVLRERDLSLAEFARRMGEPMEAIAALLAGQVAITIGTARRLHEVLGASVEFWMTRDFQYREDTGKGEAVEAKKWLSELPVGDMIKFGWLSPPPHPSEEVRACLQFFGVPDVRAWREAYARLDDAVAYRTSPSLDSRPASVATWLRRGVIEAEGLNCDVWKPEKFRESLTTIRTLTRAKDPRSFVSELQRRCAECGVAVVVIRAPAGCRASGATQFFREDRALLLLSSRHMADDQFWFTFFHEAGHLILHGHRELVLEGLDTTSAIEEEQANAFAGGVIVPSNFQEAFLRLRANAREVIRFARRIGVSPGVLVGQLQHRGILGPNQLNGLKRRFAWTERGLVSRERA
jgi:HTH-type transcriptional regulator/antitoxin HigA